MFELCNAWPPSVRGWGQAKVEAFFRRLGLFIAQHAGAFNSVELTALIYTPFRSSQSIFGTPCYVTRIQSGGGKPRGDPPLGFNAWGSEYTWLPRRRANLGVRFGGVLGAS